jgi:hypothetical protein
VYARYVQYANTKQISSFLRTILEKPNHAAKVKSMCVEQMVELENDELEDEIEEQELALLTKACETYGLQPYDASTHDRWMSGTSNFLECSFLFRTSRVFLLHWRS